MKEKKLIVFVLIVAIIAILNYIFGWSSHFSDTENVKQFQKMVENHYFLCFIGYCILTIVGCVVLALPGIVFAIAAGILFGPLWGTLACLIGTTLGAMVAFWVGRFFLQDSIRPKAEKNKYLKKWLFDDSSGNQLFILMITRLVPLFPFNLQNFAYGVTGISFSVYSIGTFLFMIPGVAMYTLGTAGIVDGKNRVLYLALAFGMGLIAIGAGFYLKKRYITANDIEGQDDSQ